MPLEARHSVTEAPIPDTPRARTEFGSSLEALAQWQAAMSRIRAFELVVAKARHEDRLPGLLHLSMGSEATAVGVIAELSEEDRVYSSHRAHGHFLAAGVDQADLFAELAGRDSGLCRGRGGSMHLMAERVVMASGIVGGTLPIALGHSLTLARGTVAIAFFGDGAVQTGTFHETLNLAALWDAPVLFVCENNGYAEFSRREEHSRVERVASYGAVYGIGALEVDCTDVEAVAVAARVLLDEVREGRGPRLLECRVTRLRPHYEGDLRVQAAGVDPMTRALGALVARGASREALLEQHRRDVADAEATLQSVLASAPLPDPTEDESFVFARPLP